MRRILCSCCSAIENLIRQVKQYTHQKQVPRVCLAMRPPPLCPFEAAHCVGCDFTHFLIRDEVLDVFMTLRRLVSFSLAALTLHALFPDLSRHSMSPLPPSSVCRRPRLPCVQLFSFLSPTRRSHPPTSFFSSCRVTYCISLFQLILMRPPHHITCFQSFLPSRTCSICVPKE